MMMKYVIYTLAEEQSAKIFDVFIDDFNLDIFDISEITSQFLKGTTCRFIVADHCWKSKCYSANAHLFVQSRQEYSIFAVVAALFS